MKVKAPPLLNPPRQSQMPEWARPTEEDKKMVLEKLDEYRRECVSPNLCDLFVDAADVFPDIKPTKDDKDKMRDFKVADPTHNWFAALTKSNMKRLGMAVELSEEEIKSLQSRLKSEKEDNKGERVILLLDAFKNLGLKDKLDEREKELVDSALETARREKSGIKIANNYLLLQNLGRNPQATPEDTQEMKKDMTKARKEKNEMQILTIIHAMQTIYKDKEGKNTPQMPPLKEVGK